MNLAILYRIITEYAHTGSTMAVVHTIQKTKVLEIEHTEKLKKRQPEEKLLVRFVSANSR